MASKIGTTALAALTPEIIVETNFIMQEASIMKGLMKAYNLPMNSGQTIDVPSWPKAVATELTGPDHDHTAGVPQVITPTSTRLTLKTVLAPAEVTDLTVKTNPASVTSDIGRLLGEAIAQSIDKSSIDLFAGFTNILGDGVELTTPTMILQAAAELANQGYNASSLYCVLNPLQAFDVKSALTQSFTDPVNEIGNEAMKTGFLGRLGGVAIFETSNLDISAGSYSAAVFHPDALGLVDFIDIDLEEERKALTRSTILSASATYANGVILDAVGRRVWTTESI